MENTIKSTKLTFTNYENTKNYISPITKSRIS